MNQDPERRRTRRLKVPGRISSRVEAMVAIRLIDLSATGARLEHANMLRPGYLCVLEFPQNLAALVLTARVVRTVEVRGAEQDAVPLTHRYESGVVFTGLSPEQQIALEVILERLAAPRATCRGRNSKPLPRPDCNA